jgi:phage baseplate assembly protein W
MLEGYYKRPLPLKTIMEQDDSERISLMESVFAMIHLICTSNFGECKHEEDFGCEIWEYDFENITSSLRFKEAIGESVMRGIQKFEPRITNVSVDVDVEQVMTRVEGRRIKNRVEILVRGNLLKTNEPMEHRDQFFIGPLSYY